MIARGPLWAGMLALVLTGCQSLTALGPAPTPTLVPTFAAPTQVASLAAGPPASPSATAPPTSTSTPISTATQASTAVPTQDETAGWSSYHDDLGQFSLLYPSDWKRWDSTGYPVIFSVRVPAGTTLGEKQMRISVIQGVSECSNTNAGGPEAIAPPEEVTAANGIRFLKEAGADAGAGNVYKLISYSTLHGSTCVTITFVLHSSNPQMYDTPPPDYDPAVESQVFDKILTTFRFDS